MWFTEFLQIHWSICFSSEPHGGSRVGAIFPFLQMRWATEVTKYITLSQCLNGGNHRSRTVDPHAPTPACHPRSHPVGSRWPRGYFFLREEVRVFDSRCSQRTAATHFKLRLTHPGSVISLHRGRWCGNWHRQAFGRPQD